VLPTSLNLALLVVQRELVEAMPGIAREYDQLVLNYKNQVIAEVTTAVPLDDAQLNRVRQALEAHTGKQIIMHTKVQQQLLHGVAINDSSLFPELELGESDGAATASDTMSAPPRDEAEPSRTQ
jgi:ATP synthase F1 delta subunit